MDLLKAIFWISISALTYAYFGYILLCIILSRLFTVKTIKNEFLPLITLIIPCYNEESVIREKIENVLKLDYPKDKLQILIASESNDKTNDIALSYKPRGVEIFSTQERIGKSVLISQAIPLARGEILVFSDANAILKQNALMMLSRNFADLKVGAVTGLLCINNSRQSHISRGEAIYKKYETLLRESNSRMGRVLNSDGALFAIRKSLYNPITPERGDDFELITRVLINKHYTIFEPEAVAFEEASITSSQEISRKIRMVSWLSQSAALLLKETFFSLRIDLAFQLISHKFMRWLTPFFLIALFIANAMAIDSNPFFKIIFLIQLSFYSFGILAMIMLKLTQKKLPLLLGLAHYFIIYNYAFMVGLIKAVFPSRKYHIWEKSRT